jgi:hypothetical protein
MSELVAFFRALWKHWITLMSGGTLLVVLVFWERSFGVLAFRWFGGFAAFLIVLACYLAWRDEHRQLEKLMVGPVLGFFFDPADAACKSSDRTNTNFWEVGMLMVGVTNTGTARADRVRLVVGVTDPPDTDLIGYQLLTHPYDEREFSVQHDSGVGPSVYVKVGRYEVWRGEPGSLSLNVGNISILSGKPDIELALRLEHEHGSVPATLSLSRTSEALIVRLDQPWDLPSSQA